MCGIAGLYSPGRRLSPDAVDTMIASMAHRGPDDQGKEVLADGQLQFGHLRLSILDLSSLGHQPMTLADRKTWIVYNGEVYNFREIRGQLASLGWSFQSECDTEVILAAYGQWGLSAVERFRGMFAFAIWDDAQQSLHLCRDRFGVKPLYYCLTNGCLAFASEMKALNLAGYTSRGLDLTAIAEFVQYGYISAPHSCFADVQTVRPGTVCTFDASLKHREHTYWNTAELYDGEGAQSLRRELNALGEEELLDRVEACLQRAFEYRMIADVPVGLFLSGGIDSSLVAALLARRAGVKLNTFTIGYDSPEFDERKYARRVAQILESTHVECAVSSQMALDLFNELPEVTDEPIGDSSMVPTLMVSRLARKDVKVALSADGADELFGGYLRYRYCGDLVRRSRLVRRLYYLSAEILDQLPRGLLLAGYAMTRGGGPKVAAISDKLRKFVRMSRAANDFEAYEASFSEWSGSEAHRFVPRAPIGGNGARAAFESAVGADPRDQFMHYDLARYLPGDLLTKMDRVSMFVSLEAREPFLDDEVARLAAALPASWKIRHGQSKYVLRRLLARYFPVDLFMRPKQGFSPPLAEWLRGPLRPVLLQELSPARVREFGILDPTAVNEAVDAFLSRSHESGSADGEWILLQLQQWAGRWLRAPSSATRRTAGASVNIPQAHIVHESSDHHPST